MTTRREEANIFAYRSKKASAKNPEPIVLEFPTEVFALGERNREIVDAIAELDNASISVFHSNPYIHISMLDYLDGSSYDFWVLSSSRMIIYPALRASTASMSRLLSHLFEEISDGKVEEYKNIVQHP